MKMIRMHINTEDQLTKKEIKNCNGEFVERSCFGTPIYKFKKGDLLRVVRLIIYLIETDAEFTFIYV